MPLRPALVTQTRARKESSRSDKQVTFNETTDSRGQEDLPTMSQHAERFSGLHSDRRPLPTDPETTVVAIDDQSIIAAEPLKPPPLDLKDCYPLPKASPVPLYMLAGFNRFAVKEVRASDPTLGSFNLFVYGRLMFPSAVHGFASHSIKGVYSPLHQRRLVPSSQDWSRANISIKHAAEIMTLARLMGFDVRRPSGYGFAALKESSSTWAILKDRDFRRLSPIYPEPTGEVTGFMLLGLTEEVLRYYDLVLCSDDRSLRRTQVVPSEENVSDSEEHSRATLNPSFERRRVTVEIQLTSGDIRSVTAFTYVWKLSVESLWHPWRPQYFGRSHGFQSISKLAS